MELKQVILKRIQNELNSAPTREILALLELLYDDISIILKELDDEKKV